MKEIIPPVSREILEKELTPDKFVRKTNKAHNELYIITHHDSPNIMQEIGRLRELSFRLAGGGIGEEVDIDHFDTDEDCYKQLIVWDPKHKEILGGYRYFIFKPNVPIDVNKLATTHLFEYSEKFVQDYLPYTIELGRSFVQPAYQSTNRARKAIFALDNLWDGLGALMVDNPEMKYFFGKVTMYPTFNRLARNYILFFLNKHFGDRENLLHPRHQLNIDVDREDFTQIFSGNNFLEDYKTLSRKVRECGENIPPLINAYMNLSPTMKSFGTMVNDDFGDVEETGIMITINDLYLEKIERHVSTYQRVKYYLKDRDSIVLK
jgi:hypothetical protein